ncbi:MAG: hypothetical protein O6851_08365 [Gemmatimonadetes bacterium]|nr:hypothetical protein [Gemmatimonadota bacterium]
MTQKGSTGLSTVLIIFAVALVGGFLLWLYRSSAALEETTPVMLEADVGEVVDLVLLSQDPSASVGRVADIDSVAVVQTLGRGVFLVGLTSANEASPFPVLLSPDLIARNTQVYGGDVVRLYGHIYSLNDSIRSQWVELGAVNEADAEAIPQGTSFLLADSLELK